MNCIEFQENLAAYLEGVLDAASAAACARHLESCPACRETEAAALKLQQRLLRRGQTASGVSLVAPVMSRIREFAERQGENNNRERSSLMKKLLSGWGLGLSAATGAAALVLIAVLGSPRAQASAAEVLARGAKAVARLSSIHFRGQLRTLPADNFSYIDADRDFAVVEVWKQFEPELKWRIEKPGRVAVMDGQSTVLYFKHANEGVKIPGLSRSAFDTEWLHRIANLSMAISNELKTAQAQGWKLDLAEQTAADGRVKSVVTIHARSGVPENDYLRNKFLQDADTRRVYRFDARTERLEAVQYYLVRPSGEVLLFDLNQIDYNQPIDPSVWRLDLPADVSWYQEVQKLPDNEKYTAMTAEQAARAFFEACAREDWGEVGKFMSPLGDRLKQYLGGLEIVSLGESFGSRSYPGRFVPYEIRLKNGFVKKHNLAVRKDNPAGRWQVDGGI